MSIEQVEEPVLDKINKARLSTLCALYRLSEEECFARFAPTGLFDFLWIKKQEIFPLLLQRGVFSSCAST
jgi:hypothetical protein